MLQLILQYLKSGIIINGLFAASDGGTRQRGNLSPLCSNIYLNEFDRLFTERGQKLVRYIDDCNIYVKSRRAGYRVMESSTKYLEEGLKLTVNREKNAEFL